MKRCLIILGISRKCISTYTIETEDFDTVFGLMQFTDKMDMDGETNI